MLERSLACTRCKLCIQCCSGMFPGRSTRTTIHRAWKQTHRRCKRRRKVPRFCPFPHGSCRDCMQDNSWIPASVDRSHVHIESRSSFFCSAGIDPQHTPRKRMPQNVLAQNRDCKKSKWLHQTVAEKIQGRTCRISPMPMPWQTFRPRMHHSPLSLPRLARIRAGSPNKMFALCRAALSPRDMHSTSCFRLQTETCLPGRPCNCPSHFLLHNPPSHTSRSAWLLNQWKRSRSCS